MAKLFCCLGFLLAYAQCPTGIVVKNIHKNSTKWMIESSQLYLGEFYLVRCHPKGVQSIGYGDTLKPGLGVIKKIWSQKEKYSQPMKGDILIPIGKTIQTVSKVYPRIWIPWGSKSWSQNLLPLTEHRPSFKGRGLQEHLGQKLALVFQLDTPDHQWKDQVEQWVSQYFKISRDEILSFQKSISNSNHKKYPSNGFWVYWL